MKTIAQSLTVSAAIYSIIFILIASFAFGSETNKNQTIDSVYVETEFAFEDEEYIDDIPFDTKSIADNYLFQESLNVSYEFEDEAYVDDIPFDTYQIVLRQTDNMVLAK